MISLNPLARRVVYVATFEIVAIALSTVLLTILSGGSAEGSLPVAVAVSVIAVVWNYGFNLLFEALERRSGFTERSLWLRIGHALGFELGLFVFTIPLYMIWYAVGPWEAFRMEAALLLFFLIYTFVFTWIFDTVFELPRAPSAA